MATEDGSHRTHRSILRRTSILKDLAGPSGYTSIQSYRTIMQYYRFLLNGYGRKNRILLTPGDCVDNRFSGTDAADVSRMLSSEFHPLIEPVKRDFDDRIKMFSPDAIGISIVYKSQLTPALALVQYIKKYYSSIRIILGGALLSGLCTKSLTLIRNAVDDVCTGPGERFLMELSGYRHAGNCHFNDPDYTGIDESLYFSPVRTRQMITSRGCYWAKCAFCEECREPFEMDRFDNVVQRINTLVETFKAGHIHFTDHAIPPALLKAPAKTSPGFTWSGFVRVTPELADDDYVKQLAESGCKMLQLGMETPDPSLLNIMNKGVNAALYPLVIENLRRHHIRSYVYLLFGYPGQSQISCELTLSFLAKYQPDYINLAVFRRPGCTPAGHPANQSRVTIRSPENETLQHGDLRRWLSSRLNRSPAVRNMRQNTPYYYKSSHAAFF